MSRIHLVLLLCSLGTASSAGAMSLTVADPELTPEAIRIRLQFSLGDSGNRLDPSNPVFQLVAAPAAVTPVAVAPRASDLIGASYDGEVRADITAVSRASLADFVSSGGR